MASSSVERPNIRIEIQNNVREVEAMDVDDEEEEEGEISDKPERPRGSKSSVEATGASEKLAERARRFDLAPDDESTPFSLSDLYSSLGLDRSGSADDLVPDTIVIRGDPSITSGDVLEYFYPYAPVGVGWSDDGACSVKFPDGGSAARALFYLSRPIDGVPVRKQTDALETNDEEGENGRSVLLRDRQVELDEGPPEEGGPFAPSLPEPVRKFKDSVDVSQVEVPIPPGYWRLSGPMGAKKKGALVRFGSRTDKKPFKTESFARAYKKPGQISERQMRELRSIFQRNRHMNQEKNPWGTLARNWEEDRLREPERRPEPIATGDRFEVKNPDLLERLGKKAVDEPVEESSSVPSAKRAKVPRMRMYADEEEERIRRKRLLRTLNAQESRLAEVRDLRRTLKAVRRAAPEIVTVDDRDGPDLSLRLRNRTRGMVFTVRAEEEREEGEEREEDRSDARSLLDKRRSDRGRPSETRKSPTRRRRRTTTSMELYRAPTRDHQTRSRRVRRRSPSRSPSDPKPRSRVAVVVRKPPTRPTVASTIWRPEAYTSSSESSSSSGDSDDSSETSEEEEEEEEVEREEEGRKRSGGRVKVRLGARR